MRILILNTWYYPNMQGGAEYSVKILAENLVKAGNDTAVFCIDNKNTGLKKEILGGVTVYRSDGGKYRLYRAYFEERTTVQKLTDKFYELYNLSISKDLKYALEDFRPEAVHCNCFSGISFRLFKIIDNKNIPLVLTLRNYFLIYPADGDKIKGKLLIKFLRKTYIGMSRHFTKKVRYVTAPSAYTLKYHTDKGFFKNAEITECIPNCTEFDYEDVKRSVEAKQSRSEEKIHFLYAGWITEPKGIRKLLDAFMAVRSEKIDLTICGSGNMENFVLECERMDERISYTGRLSSEALAREYEKADVLIVPSVWDEPFGRVIIEGNRHGLPVICTDRGGIPEISRQMHSGIVYDADDTGELIKAIEYMLDRSRYNEYHKAILENIEYYSVENQIKSYMDIYQRMIKEN